MHFFSAEHNYFGGNGIVGAQIPIGTGIAFAEKYKGTQNLCVTMFGDGAARQGALHESFNMAMTWKLPVLTFAKIISMPWGLQWKEPVMLKIWLN